MKRLLILSLCACADPALSQPLRVEAPPEMIRATPTESIELSVRNFAKWATGDSFISAQHNVADARIGYFGGQVWASKFAKYKLFDIEITDVEPLEIDEKSASVRVNYQLLSRSEVKTAPINREEKLELKRSGSSSTDPKTGITNQNWQIVPPAMRPAEPQQETVENFDWLAYLSWKIAQKPLAPADYDPVQSLKNLKELSLAALQFSQDYDSIATAPEYLKEALEVYVRSDSVFFVPNSYERYAFNTKLMGRHIEFDGAVQVQPPANLVTDTENVVLFYEGRDEKLDFRYDGRAAVGFANGGVDLVSPDEAKNLRWTP